MSNPISSEVFFIDDLRKCGTEDEVEKYFKGVSIDTLDKKIVALTKATGSSRIDYFDNKLNEEKKYKALLSIFLDEEFRSLRGY